MEFYKYQGTGNDFVMIDNRQNTFIGGAKLIAQMCDRHFGIGADGLILLESHSEHDFKMVYYNADGNESSMCGNGGRCITAFANFLGLIKDKTTFEAIDGLHHATLKDDLIYLQMVDVKTVEKYEDHVFLNTGSPHHVQMNTDLELLDIKAVGSKIRYGAPYFKDGSNVNFVKKLTEESFFVRTYERGVEDETRSCGTGVTAVAIAMHSIGETDKNLITLHTQGGQLQVSFNKNGKGYDKVFLIGPAIQVFKGTL